MTLKRKLIIAAIMTVAVPAVLMIILSIPLIGVFMIIHPDLELSLVQGVSVSNPYIIKFLVLWLILAVLCVAAAGVCAALYIGKSILNPLRRLSEGLEHMKEGDLSYEFVGSGDRELRELFTSFEELRLMLQRSVRRDIEAENLRTTLMVNLSHDIKTPVTSIKGYVEGLRDGVADTPEKRRKYINTIYIKAEQIERLADNLSVYSKLEMGRMQYSMRKTDAAHLLRCASAEFELDLQAADMDVTVKLSDEPLYCMADTENLGRVFSNLITNAIKYKKDGRGSLSLSAERGAGGIRIVFADRGRGIPEGDLERIFDSFFRADPSRNSAIQGNGLGLSVCKRIVSDHGGKIWARNRAGGGSEFIIILPEYDKITEENL